MRKLLLALLSVSAAVASGVEAQNATLYVLCDSSNEGPCNHPANWSITGPVSFTGTQTNVSYPVPPGTYQFQYISGGPGGSPIVTVRPRSRTLTLASGQVDAFTIVFNYTCSSISTPVVDAPTTPQDADPYTLSWSQLTSSDLLWEIEEWSGGTMLSSELLFAPNATFAHAVNEPAMYSYRIRSTNRCEQYSTAVIENVEVFPNGFSAPLRNPSFNFDANADLLWWNSSTGVFFAQFMNGAAATGGGVVTMEPNTDWQVIATADTDGDSDTEILLQNINTRQPALYRVNGHMYVDGTVPFRFRSGAGDAASPAYNGRALGLADFNGDGRGDVLWRTPAGAVDAIWMHGTTVLDRRQIWREPDANWKIVGIGDVDGDTRADLFWRNVVNGLAFLSFANGSSGVFHNEPNLSWALFAAGDVSGDGRADAVWRHSDGRVWVQLLNGVSTIGSGVVWAEADAAWQLEGLADVNGDLRHDLIWRHTDGRVFVVLLDGASAIGSGVAHHEPDANWQLVVPGRVPQDQ